MYTDTEAIIMRQTKTVNGRRMILLFSKKYGKISAGSSMNESGKNKSALALRPFTYGRYELFKNKDSFNINGAEVISSYYRLGEDVDKYMNASYVLEFTDKLLPEGEPAPGMFNLLTDFMSMMEQRKSAYGTLVLGFLCKALSQTGHEPVLNGCAACGSKDALFNFSVKEGGLICPDCIKTADINNTLIFPVGVVIIDILNYLFQHPLRNLESLALNEDMQRQVEKILKAYIAYHLEIEGLKSEGFII